MFENDKNKEINSDNFAAEESAIDSTEKAHPSGLTLLNLSERKQKRLIKVSGEDGKLIFNASASENQFVPLSSIAGWNQRLRLNRKLMAASILAFVLSFAALGAVADGIIYPNGNGIIAKLSEKIGLKSSSVKSSSSNQPIDPNAPTQLNGIQLSKEYVYAGSRNLAVEDYGIAQPNPTPTP